MRPYLLHLCILATLAALGIVLFVAESFFFETNGMLFAQHVATRLYWVVFMGYAIISTAIVASVYVFHRLVNKVFTKKAVILSHVLPIGFVWLLIELNIHDIIQNAWQRSAHREEISGKRPVEYTVRQKPQIPQAPLLKSSLYALLVVSSGLPMKTFLKTLTCEV